jgi:hypothetical protein
MRVVNFPNSNPLVARCLSGVLAALMVVSPVAGQTSGAAASPAASPSSSTKKTAKSTSAGKKGRSHAGRSARAARTARIKQAFVASTELRPMAQQLATLRTPAAYAGVSKYAHSHTGEAASAAYLALGHAYLADRGLPTRRRICALPGRPGRNWPTTRIFWALKRTTRRQRGRRGSAAARFRCALSGQHLQPAGAGAGSHGAAHPEQRRGGAARAGGSSDSASRAGYQLAQGAVANALGQTGKRSRYSRSFCWLIR